MWQPLVTCFLGLTSSVLSINETSWQQYIVGPQTNTVYPKSILSVSGNVQNPEGLLPPFGNTVFTRSEGGEIPSVTIDFGINLVGFLSIQFNGASNNSPGIRLAFSETKQFLSDVSDFSRSNMANPITPGSDQIAVRPEPYLWNDTWGCKNGSQVCSDGLHGFRYVKIYLDALESDAPITKPFGTVTISRVELHFTGFLATPDTFQGWFECSDADLNKYWYAGVYTNDITTDYFRENDVDPRGAFNSGLDGKLVLFDGAKRDRDPYIGDVAVSGKTSYVAHGNLSSDAAKNVLIDLAENQRSDGYIPSASIMNYTLQLFDYPLWWVIAVNDYILYTGDLDFLETYYPNLKRALNEFYPAHTSTNNLLSRPAGYGDFAFVGRDGEASYYNALYVWALQAGSKLALWANDNSTAVEWELRSEVVSNATDEAFWDESVGAYKNSKDSTAHPQDANAIAVLAGIAKENKARSVLDYLANNTALPYGNAFMDDDSLVGGGSKRVYAFISTFDLRARFEMGDPTSVSSALDEIRRLYGWMYTQDPEITFWEGVGPDGSMYEGGFTSAAHGWSTGIVGILTNYVLGVTFFEPGGTGLSFAPPYTQEITWARGQAVMDGTPVGVQWGDVGDIRTMELDLPEEVEAKVIIRDTSDIVVSHNGKIVWHSGIAKVGNVRRNDKGHVEVLGLRGGKHTVISQRV